MSDNAQDLVRLKHVIDAISKIELYTHGVNRHSFLEDSMILDACLRQLQIIGEARNKLSKTIQSQNEQIPWSKIIGLRILIVHKYFGVDPYVIWDIIKDDLPNLKIQIAQVILEIQ